MLAATSTLQCEPALLVCFEVQPSLILVKSPTVLSGRRGELLCLCAVHRWRDLQGKRKRKKKKEHERARTCVGEFILKIAL